MLFANMSFVNSPFIIHPQSVLLSHLHGHHLGPSSHHVSLELAQQAPAGFPESFLPILYLSARAIYIEYKLDRVLSCLKPFKDW